jgi:hypothetical protein
MADELREHQTKVRLTMFPDRLTVVDKGEIPGLRSQGLLIEDPPADVPADDQATTATGAEPVALTTGQAAAPAAAGDPAKGTRRRSGS